MLPRLILAACALFATAVLHSGASIGMATAPAGFFVDGAAVPGSATLFEGTTVRTGKAPSRLQLSNGSGFSLSPDSQVKVFGSRFVLESGYGDFRPSGKVRVEARGLTVAGAGAGATARVAVHGTNLVQVATASGLFRVYSSGGILVANVEAGAVLDFDPPAQGAQPISTAVGCLLKKDGKFVIFDQTTRVLFELRGTGFEKEWGKRVQANGIARPSGQPGAATTQIMEVTSLTPLGAGDCDSVASTIGAEVPAQPGGATTGVGKPPPPPKTGGMSAGAKVAIGVAVAGGGAGAGIVLGKRGRS